MKLLALWRERFFSSQYTQLRREELPQDSCEKYDICRNEHLGKLPWPLAILWALTVLFAGVLGSYVSTQSRYRESIPQNSCLKGTISDPRARRFCLSAPASIGSTETIFQYNSSFAAAPANAAVSEPIWDSLIPSKSPVSSVLCFGSYFQMDWATSKIEPMERMFLCSVSSINCTAW